MISARLPCLFSCLYHCDACHFSCTDHGRAAFVDTVRLSFSASHHSRDCPIFYMRTKVRKDLHDQQKTVDRFSLLW